METAETKAMKTSVLLKRFVPYYRKYVGTMVMDLFCAALTTVCELVLPMILRYITNVGMTDLSALTLKTILTIGTVYLVLRIIDGMASFYMAYTGHVMGASIETDMRRTPLPICRSFPTIILIIPRWDRSCPESPAIYLT